ncbi:class I SAM-dependent methyltransferase [Lutibacter sp. B2]|nr:class I SAM-dependent methyltransferase [Lutibacter sp. B2]
MMLNFQNISTNTSTELNLDQTPKELWDMAEKLIKEGHDPKAEIVYKKLLNNTNLAPLAYFRLGEIENRNKDIEKSSFYHTKAFKLDKKLTLRLVAPDHPNYYYQYDEVEEIEVKICPLCNGESELHSCFNMISNNAKLYGFNPIRKWRLCRKCNHIFAENYPKNLEEIFSSTGSKNYLKPNVGLFSILSSIISNINSVVSGNKLLEVGVGAGEMISVAKGMLYDVTGLDIRPVYAQNVSERLGVPVYSIDIMRFETDKLFDVIILGDVIEHLSKPTDLLIKCSKMLNEKGVIWISTPNFESAFSNTMKDKDAMWRVWEHLNYFSYTSLNNVLNNLGFEVKDYKISQHYNGSMEVIAKRKS